MNKYLNIYRIFLNNAMSYLAQYRRDTWIQIAAFGVWIIMLFFTVDIIFGHTNTLGGWNKAQVYLMIIYWTASYELTTLIYRRSTNKLPSVITDGDLDLLLVKPAHALFLTTLRQVEPRSVVGVLTQVGLAIWVVLSNNISVTFLGILLSVVALLCSVVVQYSIAVIANTLSFWFLRIDNINDLTWNLKTIGRYPTNILPSLGYFIFMVVLPVGLMGYVPLLIFTGTWPLWYILFPLLLSAIFLLLTISFWNFAIRNYSSASS